MQLAGFYPNLSINSFEWKGDLDKCTALIHNNWENTFFKKSLNDEPD